MAMAVPPEVVDKIRSFSEDCSKREEEQRASDQPDELDLEDHNRRLDRTLRGLQEQVRRQEAVLQELRLTRPLDLPQPDSPHHARFRQIRHARDAYKTLAAADPELPVADSPFGGLLALRETTRQVNELQASITGTARELNDDRERLKVEETNLRDAGIIRAGLRARIESVRIEQEGDNSRGRKGKEKAVDQEKVAKEMMQLLRRRNTEMEKGTGEMKTALKSFIDERLAAMLAAEDLGGPTVGDQLDISDAVLEAGYTAHGKEQKPKNNAEDEMERGQRRIDGYLEGDGPRSKRGTAGAEMHQLIEDLLQAASTSTSYIELDRDSPASRFLVKAKIAQYHPRDSRRLRLIDVASEISD